MHESSNSVNLNSNTCTNHNKGVESINNVNILQRTLNINKNERILLKTAKTIYAQSMSEEVYPNEDKCTK